MEKETGSRYVFADGSLRPVLNYASARLLFSDPPTVVSVSAHSLAGIPHGQPVGVVGAPDALPAPGSVAGEVWTVCAADSSTTVRITGGTSDALRPLGTDDAALVRAGDAGQFLLWQGQRLKISEPWLPKVLGAAADPVDVPATWLDTLPAGPDLALSTVVGQGRAGPAIDGQRTRIGQLFVVHAATDRYFQLRSGGLVELGPMAYAMTSADPRTAALYPGGAVRPAELSLAGLARLPIVDDPLPAGMPVQVPSLVPPDDGAWCVRETVTGRVDVGTGGIAAIQGATDGLKLTRTSDTAAAIAVDAGQGGLVVPGRPGQAPGAALYLITDTGVKYPVPTAEAAKRLGYSADQAYPVRPELLSLLPTGPPLETPS